MSESAIEHRTRGVALISQFAPLEEEHHAIADGASASALLAGVIEQLAETAFCQTPIEGNVPGEPVDEDLNHSDRTVAVRFLRLALAAIAAAARVHPDVPNHPLTRSKALLLERLDADAADWIEACEDWDDLGEAYFILAVTSLLKGASAAACELDGLYEVTSEELDIEGLGEDDDGEEDPDPAARFGESLFQSATLAVAAAQWFEERHVEERC